jgi:hypothetical protein
MMSKYFKDFEKLMKEGMKAQAEFENKMEKQRERFECKMEKAQVEMEKKNKEIIDWKKNADVHRIKCEEDNKVLNQIKELLRVDYQIRSQNENQLAPIFDPRALEEKKKKEATLLTCKVCLDKQVNMIGGCGHMICDTCYDRLPVRGKKCPICRGKYNRGFMTDMHFM